MFYATQLIGFMTVAASKATITCTDSSVSTTDSQNYTFNSQAIGTEAANRQILVSTQWNGAAPIGSISSLTVNGVAASAVGSGVTAADGQSRTEMWIAAVPTGTSVTIQVNKTNTNNNMGIGVWAIYGALSTAHATASDSDVGTNALSASVNIPAGGVAVGAALANATVTFTWTGITENFDEAIEVPYHSGASLAFAAAQTGLSITATPSAGGAGEDTHMIVASFGPA